MNFTSQKNLKDILDAVESCATLTAVARLLYTTQPNVSKTIAAAERDYGVELVKRNQTPVSLTPAGSYLKQRLERQLSYAAETSRGIKQFAPQRRLSLEQARGRIAAASIAPYPPGVPVAAPGERITGEILDYFKTIGYPLDEPVFVLEEGA